MREARASDLAEGNIYIEDGMESVVIVALDQHGDRILVTGADGLETSLDIDDAVTIVEFSDDEALSTLVDDEEGDELRELAATHLEVSINGGEVDTVRGIALNLLAALLAALETA